MAPRSPAREAARQVCSVSATLAAASLLLLLLTGCATTTPHPLVPTPPMPPALPVPQAPSMPALHGPEDEVPLPDVGPPSAGDFDAILHSPWARHPEMRAEIDRWIRFWTGQEGPWFPVYLQRMSAHEALVDSLLGKQGLPSSLRYLPVIESGYSTGAVSRASAVGLWQLMAPTARRAGLRVGPLVDERRDPVRATGVAVSYLAELRDRFGSWFLALAAYNGGPGRMARLLALHAPDAEPSDSLFWEVRPHLPRETRDFVPRFLAAAAVARDPGAHGLETLERRKAFRFDRVRVPDATSLDVVAEAAGVTEEEIVALNPQLVRRVTPRGVETELRVPDGRAARFELAYGIVPPDRRVTVVEHVVASGETLWGIARRYGVPLPELEAANPEVRPERLRPGDRLLVPSFPGALRRAKGG